MILSVAQNMTYIVHVCAWIRHTLRRSKHAGVGARRLGTRKSCER